MNAQVVITTWTRRWDRGETELVIAAPNDVDTVGIVRRAIAAENNVWRADGEGLRLDGGRFRKGNWTVCMGWRRKGVESPMLMSHDECGLAISADPETHKVTTTYMPAYSSTREVFESFLTWHAAAYPPAPAEPTGLGAVVRVVHSFTRSLDNPVHPWIDYSTGVSLSWQTICELGPVTVISEGVTT